MSSKSFRAFVDRIEGDKAVLLVGDKEQHRVILPVEYLPNGAGEGAILTVNLGYDSEITAKALADSLRLIERLSGQDE